MMALTATATSRVKKDILTNLKMSNSLVLEQSFNRPNLFYEVRRKTSVKKVLALLLTYIRHNSCVLMKGINLFISFFLIKK